MRSTLLTPQPVLLLVTALTPSLVRADWLCECACNGASLGTIASASSDCQTSCSEYARATTCPSDGSVSAINLTWIVIGSTIALVALVALCCVFLCSARASKRLSPVAARCRDMDDELPLSDLAQRRLGHDAVAGRRGAPDHYEPLPPYVAQEDGPPNPFITCHAPVNRRGNQLSSFAATPVEPATSNSPSQGFSTAK